VATVLEERVLDAEVSDDGQVQFLLSTQYSHLPRATEFQFRLEIG
jgi:hypothetical protein